MPLMPSESHFLPRSVLRHRPLNVKKLEQPKVPSVKRASRRRTPEMVAAEQHTAPCVARKAQTQKAVSAETTEVPEFTRISQPDLIGSSHSWVVYIGVGMIIALVLALIGQFILPWVMTTWDDWHYGRPRTSQVDAFVGHEQGRVPSHFLAINLHGQIEVIEWRGGDSTHSITYLGPQLYGPGSDLQPVALHFVDTPHDHHHPDLVVQVQETQLLFCNTGTRFVACGSPSTP